MTYLECECSHRRTDEEEEIQRRSSAHTDEQRRRKRFNVGGLLVLINPPACVHHDVEHALVVAVVRAFHLRREAPEELLRRLGTDI